MSIQPLNVPGGVMSLAGLTAVTGVAVSAIASGQRLGVGASLVVLETAVVAGLCMRQTALETAN